MINYKEFEVVKAMVCILMRFIIILIIMFLGR